MIGKTWLRFAHSLGVEPEDMWSGNAQFGIRDICAALMERNAAQPEMVRLYIPCYKANRLTSIILPMSITKNENIA